ncbi:GIY-YIG nuclease family protein [bacterium]|nr:GIY-YIG nuclease family protein [bacterium]
MSLSSLPIFDLDSGFSVVDIETTGNSSRNGYVIEIGIVNIKDRCITESYQTLVRPPIALPPFITQLTGLRDSDLVAAPPFEEITHDIKTYLDGNFFVAHNVSFDYEFLKTEFERAGESFYKDRFCTVKLGRKLFPGYKQYNLDALIERFGVNVQNRHRALGDAMATAEILLKYLHHPNAVDVFTKFARALEKTEKWRERLEPEIMQLPSAKGVYMFKDANDLPMYIGKSNNIRSRVLSHLREDDIPKKKRLLRYTERFDAIVCSSELESLILESRLIKKHQPFYNVQQIQRKGYVFVKITNDTYPKLLVVDSRTDDDGEYVGPFRSAKFIEYLLDKTQKHLKLCPELMKPRRNQKGFCFSYQLGGCSGACGGGIDPEAYSEHIEEAKTILSYYTHMDTKENIDLFLKSREARKPELTELRKSLRREKSRIKDIPESYEEKYMIHDPEDHIGYLIVDGLLKKVFREDELQDIELTLQSTDSDKQKIMENQDTLDERLTIQRYVRSNRNKLKIVSLKTTDRETYGAYLS